VFDQINRDSHLPSTQFEGVERRVSILAVASF
jgi:hypothetical protein